MTETSEVGEKRCLCAFVKASAFHPRWELGIKASADRPPLDMEGGICAIECVRETHNVLARSNQKEVRSVRRLLPVEAEA